MNCAASQLALGALLSFFIASSAYAADTTIKGTTADASAASLEVTNSSDASLFFVRNDGSVGLNDSTPEGKFDITAAGADNLSALVVDQADTDQAAIAVNASNTAADVIDLDGSSLTTGNFLQGTVSDSFSSDAAFFSVTGTAVNSAALVKILEYSSTPANDVDVAAIHIERGADDARIVYDEGADTWMLDQGAGAGLVAIATGAVGGNTLDQSYDEGGAGAGRTIVADSGSVAVTVSDGSNNAAMILTQNDATNDPDALSLVNAGAGSLVRGSVTDNFSTDASLINVTGTALDTATLVKMMELSTTPGNDVDVALVHIERGADDARIVYDEGADTWMLDQGAGAGLVAIATGSGAGNTLDQAYDQGGVGAGRAITVDSGAIQMTGSNNADETLEVTNSADGGVFLVENTGAGDSFRVNDDAADATPFVIDATGEVGIGTTNPTAGLEVAGTIAATPSAVANIAAAGGITATRGIMRVQGSGGAVDITANPQIAAGVDGQLLIVQGTSNANTVKLDDGTGLRLAGTVSFTLAQGDTIMLEYDSSLSLWVELKRSDN